MLEFFDSERDICSWNLFSCHDFDDNGVACHVYFLDEVNGKAC